MPLFHRDDDKRRHILGIAIAMAAHVERNTPQVFPPATTDKLEAAADELLGEGELSYETVEVAKRALQALRTRRVLNCRWYPELVSALEAIDDED